MATLRRGLSPYSSRGSETADNYVAGNNASYGTQYGCGWAERLPVVGGAGWAADGMTAR